MALGPELRRLGMRPRLVENVPGRLVVHFHVARELPEQHQGFARQLLALVCLPDAVTLAEPDFPTGNLLIQYDPQQATAEWVLAYLRGLMRIYDRHWEPLTGVPMAELPGVLERLSAVLRQELAARQSIGDTTEVPDHVWSWTV